MSNEDILLTAKVGKLDSKEATDKLHKELNSIMGKLKVGYSQQDLDKMVGQACGQPPTVYWRERGRNGQLYRP